MIEKTEALYEALAINLDTVGQDKAALYLAKTALALAREIGDTDRALKIIADCRHDLDP